MFKVLAYHKIEDKLNFEKQLIFLKKKYSLVSLKDLDKLRQHSYPKKKPPLLITFDDGDISVYNHAFPILKKHHCPAILFVITKLIGSLEPFWWDIIKSPAMVREVKEWPNNKRMAFIENEKRNTAKDELEYPQLTWNQLSEMQGAGIDIANHSHTHPLFDKCSPAEIEFEMDKSIEILKQRGFLYNIFAYPNGNFSSVSEGLLRRANIKYAFLFDHKVNPDVKDPLRISRLMVDDTMPLWKFRFILSGWHSRLLPFKTKILNTFK